MRSPQINKRNGLVLFWTVNNVFAVGLSCKIPLLIYVSGTVVCHPDELFSSTEILIQTIYLPITYEIITNPYLRPMNFRWKIAQFFEIWWWKNYLSKQPVHEYVDWKKNYWTTFLETAEISILPTDKILDAGCGPAGIFMVFPENEVTAIDPLLDSYRAQIPHFQEHKVQNVRFQKVSLECLNLQHQFDKVFCLNTINHVSDLGKSMQNLCGSLKTNGILYLSVDAHNFALLKSIFRALPGDILHPHQLDLQEYQMLLEKNAMQVQSIRLIKKDLIFSYYLLTASNLKTS